jgi:carboxyl-terminal processing protease
VYRSSLQTSPYKLAVLVNDMTASASEILAGAIQDSKAGKLVGIKTYARPGANHYTHTYSEAYEKYGKKQVW